VWYDDAARLEVKVGLVANISEAPVQIVLNGTSLGDLANPDASMEFTVKSQMTSPNIAQKIEMFNYVTNSYETVNTSQAGLNEIVTHVVIGSNPARFVNPSTKAIQVRLAYKANGIVANNAWSAKVNLASWVTNP
jgi:hypothetical protein